jgi:glycosyltransferase involved in cell wall biosynthesis
MKALALVESPEHVCCRYRIRAFAPALEAAGIGLEVQGLARGALARLRQIRAVEGAEVVLVQRKLLPAWQIGMVRKRARRLVFDFDDAILYRDSYDRRGPFDRKRGARFARSMALSDLVIAGNDFLAECARAAGARASAVRVIPTCVEESLYRPRQDASASLDHLEMVWIGSSSTLNGLESQRSLFERLGREVPGLRLRMICDRFLEFSSLPVVPVEWRESTEAEELRRGDVGISWVPDDRWSRGKCGLKVLQFQAAGLPVVANPVGVHTRMIEPGTSGFLAETADDWVAALRALAADPSLRSEMGRAARANQEANYSVRAWSGAFVAALLGQTTGPGPHLGHGGRVPGQISANPAEGPP